MRPRQFLRRGGVPWSPWNLPRSLVYAYWTPDIGVTDAGGGSVSNYIDRVTGAALAQATSGSRPVLGATAFFGRPGITYDGIASNLEAAPSPTAVPIGSTSFEVWASVRQDATPDDGQTSRQIVSWGGATNAIGLGRSIVNGVNRARAIVTISSTVNTVDNISVDFSGRHVLRLIFTATSAQVDVDGIAGQSLAISSPNISNTRMRFGANPNGTATAFFKGVQRELVITAPLGTLQATQMYTFLRQSP